MVNYRETPVDVALVIRRRLEQLGLEQRDLAIAAQVTESYISQLLTRKKTPPGTDRTGIYDKMEQFLKLPAGELARLADQQRLEELKKKLADPPAPLLKEVRGLVLGKCRADKQGQMRAIFERQAFGELERLVIQVLLSVVKNVAKKELENEDWLRTVAEFSHRSHEEMRVAILEFLDTDVSHVSIENCVSFLDPLLESWDIDLATFGIEIRLNQRAAPGHPQRFEFAQVEPEADRKEELGFREFLGDESLSRDATEEEIQFLRALKFRGRWPTALYYYRELQNLRDPLHFRAVRSKQPSEM
jgi:transcriptional regulator with XRE-family HTH domain